LEISGIQNDFLIPGFKNGKAAGLARDLPRPLSKPNVHARFHRHFPHFPTADNLRYVK